MNDEDIIDIKESVAELDNFFDQMEQLLDYCNHRLNVKKKVWNKRHGLHLKIKPTKMWQD